MSDLINELHVVRKFLKLQNYEASAEVVAKAIAEITALRAAAVKEPASGIKAPPRGEDANAASCLHESPAPKGRR